jgi:predicted GIY-YIG superfamily endonuclease
MEQEFPLTDYARAPRIGGVYAIDCHASGDAYIGGSCDLRGRLRRHLWNLRKGSGERRLQAITNRYGVSSLTFRVLEECHTADIARAEEYWQRQLSPSLCIKIGGWRGNAMRGNETATIVTAQMERDEMESFANLCRSVSRSQSYVIRAALLLLFRRNNAGCLDWSRAAESPEFVRSP